MISLKLIHMIEKEWQVNGNPKLKHSQTNKTSCKKEYDSDAGASDEETSGRPVNHVFFYPPFEKSWWWGWNQTKHAISISNFDGQNLAHFSIDSPEIGSIQMP